MISLIDLIQSVTDKAQALSNEKLTLVYIHPNHAKALNGIDEISGMKIIIPKWEDLERLAILMGIDVKSKEFWDPNNVFILPSH